MIGVKQLGENSWWNTAPDLRNVEKKLRFPPLDSDAECDLLIIGAGIVGLTTAYLVNKQKPELRIAVVEACEICGATGASTGHVDAIPDTGLSTLEQQHGLETTKAVVNALKEAISTISAICQHENILCDLKPVRSYLFADAEDSPSGLSKIESECQSARNALVDARTVDHIPLPFKTLGTGCLFTDSAFRINPLAYIHGLARVLTSTSTVRIFEHSRVIAQPAHVAGVLGLVANVLVPKPGTSTETTLHTLRCNQCLFATHSSFGPMISTETRAIPFVSYVVAIRIEHPIEEDALFWDTHEPYRYIRVASSDLPNVLLIGGYDHHSGSNQSKSSSHELDKYVNSRFPNCQILAKWSSVLWNPTDNLPFIGELPGGGKRMLVASGFSGQGLSFGTAAAMTVTELLQGKETIFAKITSPARFGVTNGKSISGLFRAGFGVTKRLIKGMTSGEKVSSLVQTPESLVSYGQGRLVRKHSWPIQNRPIALYREKESDGGRVHVMSSKCTHRGCTVQWNEQDSCWDCPCHGGRYSATGVRIAGPPERDLSAEEW